MTNTFLLRASTAIILIMHSIPGMLDGGVDNFGNLYLNEIGFAPFGRVIAWAVKISHVAAAACFVLNKYIMPASVVTLFILIMGIVMVHYPEGWYVVGGGRNGVEFNFLLICVIVTIMFPDGLKRLVTTWIEK